MARNGGLITFASALPIPSVGDSGFSGLLPLPFLAELFTIHAAIEQDMADMQELISIFAFEITEAKAGIIEIKLNRKKQTAK